jgi:hypothetical protein
MAVKHLITADDGIGGKIIESAGVIVRLPAIKWESLSRVSRNRAAQKLKGREPLD